MLWRCRNRLLDLRHPVVMGVLNVTPDSFSDGGRHFRFGHLNVGGAVDRGAEILAEGAAIIDVGGESTRPGAAPVEAAAEIERVVPVIEQLASRFDVAISVDTSRRAVMQAAVEAGAGIVNDVRALRDPGARAWAAAAGAGVCLMHMQGEPPTMQDHPDYRDVVAEVAAFLAAERDRCIAAGIGAEAIAVDPGIGFGKSQAHNVALLRRLAEFTALGCPVLLGVSRKSLIGQLLGGRAVEQRLYGGLGLAAYAVSRGAKIIRTHDVAATVDAIGVLGGLLGEQRGDQPGDQLQETPR